ncbi:MAG: hypothetical protein WDM81_06520 [Rhizomicrobium sp.]
MEDLNFHHTAGQRAGGARKMAIIGVVASGNLEVLAERGSRCRMPGGDQDRGRGLRRRGGTPCRRLSWSVYPTGGLRFSINDGGARPDTVALRLAQAVRLMEDGQ